MQPRKGTSRFNQPYVNTSYTFNRTTFHHLDLPPADTHAVKKEADTQHRHKPPCTPPHLTWQLHAASTRNRFRCTLFGLLYKKPNTKQRTETLRKETSCLTTIVALLYHIYESVTKRLTHVRHRHIRAPKRPIKQKRPEPTLSIVHTFPSSTQSPNTLASATKNTILLF